MYNYENEKNRVFLEENQQSFLEIRDKIHKALKEVGAFKAGKMIASGDTWLALAFIDRLVELGEIKEVTCNVIANDRVFVAKYKGIHV